MKKRLMRPLCLLATLVLVLGLFACGGGESQTTGTEGGAQKDEFVPALDTKTACSITVAGSYSNFEALEAAFDDFKEYYPNVDLSYVKLDDYNQTIVTALEGDEAPNVFVSLPWMRDKAEYEGVFAAAENLADESLGIDLNCIREGLLLKDADGSVPMVPVFTTTLGMLVNEDLFEKEGIAIPQTYDELLAVCKAFKEKGYISPLAGYMNDRMCYYMTYPDIAYQVSGNSEAIAALNSLKPEAGEYLRPSMERLADFFSHDYFNKEACAEITDDYESLIFRFFEGDIPMMVAQGDIASGTGKREAMSEAFTAHPFKYSLHPLPFSEDSPVFLNLYSLSFSVNKNCNDLDMTNEFMRFLIRPESLDMMAKIKRLGTPCHDLSSDEMYASFGEVDEKHTIYGEALGISDEAVVQMRAMSYKIFMEGLSPDEALANYGSYTLG